MELCSQCTKPFGALSPASEEHLLGLAHKDDDLSLSGATVELADGSHSAPIDVQVYVTSAPIVPVYGGASVPLISFRGEHINLFLDRTHVLFRGYRVRPEVAVAVDVAQYIYDQHRSLLKQSLFGLHSLPVLATALLEKYSEALEDGPERVRFDIAGFFELVQGRLVEIAGTRSEDFYSELTEVEQRALVGNIIAAGKDVSLLATWKQTGEYFGFVSADTVVNIFRKAPELFFDGAIWSVPYSGISGIDERILSDVRSEIASKYMNCLEDCSAFLRYNAPEPLTTYRARASVDYLNSKIV
jgi:hypothetical protein